MTGKASTSEYHLNAKYFLKQQIVAPPPHLVGYVQFKSTSIDFIVLRAFDVFPKITYYMAKK